MVTTMSHPRLIFLFPTSADGKKVPLPFHLASTFFLRVRCPWCSRYRRREMNTATRVQILDETDCISHSTNTLEKDMNQVILPPAMGK